MPVKSICVAPHGGIVLDSNQINVEKTRKGFENISDIFDKKDISHLFIVDPHDIVYKQKIICFLSSTYSEEKINKIYRGSRSVNLALLYAKFKHTQHKVEINHIVKWGTTIPLHFLGAKNRSITVATIDRKLPANQIHTDGYKIFEVLNNLAENIGIVFSCDLSHSHSTEYTNFPYHSNSKVYDEYILNLFDNQKIENYNAISDEIVKTARTDAHAQLTMLAGICDKHKYNSKVFSYEVPSYYGMLTGIIDLK